MRSIWLFSFGKTSNSKIDIRRKVIGFACSCKDLISDDRIYWRQVAASNDQAQMLYIQGNLTARRRSKKQIPRVGEPYPAAGLANGVRSYRKKGVIAPLKG